MKTYNIQIGDQIYVVQANGCSVTHSGALIFTGGKDGTVVEAFNKDEWERVWVV